MTDHLFEFSCPCCDKRIEVDTRTGKARAVRPQERQGGQDLEQLLRKEAKDRTRLDDLFKEASSDEAKRRDELERRLQRAKEEAKRDPKERPRSPFDLD